MWWLLLVFLSSAGKLVNAEFSEEDIRDGELSRKILGQSVVTSVSVVMDIGNGTKTIFTDPLGVPMDRPTSSSEIASPINLLNPDRYEFYTFDEEGNLVRRLMSLQEIKGIIATGDSDGLEYDSNMSEAYIPEKRVNDVLSNVQNVLKEEMEIHGTKLETFPPLDTPDVSDSWNMILPAVFGNSGADITPGKTPNHVTPDTIMIEPTQSTSKSSISNNDLLTESKEQEVSLVHESTTKEYVPLNTIPPKVDTTEYSTEKTVTEDLSTITEYQTTNLPTIQSVQSSINCTTIKNESSSIKTETNDETTAVPLINEVNSILNQLLSTPIISNINITETEDTEASSKVTTEMYTDYGNNSTVTAIEAKTSDDIVQTTESVAITSQTIEETTATTLLETTTDALINKTIIETPIKSTKLENATEMEEIISTSSIGSRDETTTLVPLTPTESSTITPDVVITTIRVPLIDPKVNTKQPPVEDVNTVTETTLVKEKFTTIQTTTMNDDKDIKNTQVSQDANQTESTPTTLNQETNITGTAMEKKEPNWTLVPTIAPHSVVTINTAATTSYPEILEPPEPIDLKAEPFSGFGLEESTKNLDNDVYLFTQLYNELAFEFWKSTTGSLSHARSVVLSPFGTISLLAMIFLGARGSTSAEMNEILKLDDMITFNPHLILKNVGESLMMNDGDSGVVTSAFVKELFMCRMKGKFLPFYKERVKAFYDGFAEEVNFKEIADIVRRRSNLQVKKHTEGKIVEFLTDTSVTGRAPLLGLGINVFETDCSAAYSEGRDGEMHFTVLPTIRQRRLVPIPAVLYKHGFLAGYEPSLDATAISIGGKNQTISTIFVMPGQQGNPAPGDGLSRLEKSLVESSFKKGAWSRLLRSLIPRHGLEVQIPKIIHRSVLNITDSLKKMGFVELFKKGEADLVGMNGIANDLYLSEMVQVNQFSTCGDKRSEHHSEIYPNSIRSRRSLKDLSMSRFEDPFDDLSYLEMPLHVRPRQARKPETPRLKFDRPFLYFVRHNPTGLILHIGRFNPRLLP